MKLWIMILTLSLFIGCSGKKDIDVSGIEISLEFDRFEQDLFSSGDTLDIGRYRGLKGKYAEFMPVFVSDIMSMPAGNDTVVAANLNAFILDEEVRNVYSLTRESYNDLEWLEGELIKMFRRYSYHFPDRPIPDVVTFISAFNYGIITSDSTLGIGLDMFLGPELEYYPAIGIPYYMYSRFSREYILPNCAKAIIQSDHDPTDVKNELLSQLIYQGKLLYTVKHLLPHVNDTLIFGYTNNQLEWCYKNEADIWGFFIENKLLFNTDPSEYVKYINEGPTTKGFPENAPGKIGAFTGYMIIESFMEEYEKTSLEQLFGNNDSQKILSMSGYKPKK